MTERGSGVRARGYSWRVGGRGREREGGRGGGRGD